QVCAIASRSCDVFLSLSLSLFLPNDETEGMSTCAEGISSNFDLEAAAQTERGQRWMMTRKVIVVIVVVVICNPPFGSANTTTTCPRILVPRSPSRCA